MSLLNRPNAERLLFFGGIIGFLLFLLRKIDDAIIIPFGLSFVFAYLASGFVMRANLRYGISRSKLSLLVVVGVNLGISAFIFFLIPIIYTQLKALIVLLPKALGILEHFYQYLLDVAGTSKYPVLRDALNGTGGIMDALPSTASVVDKIVKGAVHSTKLLRGVASFFVITPLLTYYILRDWVRASEVFFDIIPARYRTDFIEITDEIRSKLSSYLVGQLKVTVLLAAFYSLALFLFEIKLSLLLGVFSGVLSIIPFVGTAFALLLNILAVVATSSDLTVDLAIVSTIFLLGQILEGNFLTPRLVGDSVDLHPAWIVFGFLSGGSIAGFVGIIFALPITVVCSVFVRFGLRLYKSSGYYRN